MIEPIAIGSTPVIEVEVSLGLLRHTLYLKDERCNPTGSVKDRSAHAMVRCLRDDGRLGRGAGLVESTSGNMGAALAWQAALGGMDFVAIVDPHLSSEHARKIERLGGRLREIRIADEVGNYLRGRLEAAEEMEASGRWIWTRQYSNPAVVSVHAETTGPEIDAQVSSFDELYVAVSTCGTLAGLGAHFHSRRPSVSVVGVDVLGSVALGGEARKRTLTGIGAGRRPDFVVEGTYDAVATVTEQECVGACREFREQTGIGVGGSTGAIIAAFLSRARLADRSVTAVSLIADGAENYESTIYSDDWGALKAIGLRTAPPPGVVLKVKSTRECPLDVTGQ